ncbi:MAG: UDP-N-acetylglucosamine 1-carboxyvinyltransferase [Patescibacteria group bacterium]|nr:UDP-N-acetylglucosamine 1-carboxyvinyltransferase [Patescibacteria group bacterium]
MNQRLSKPQKLIIQGGTPLSGVVRLGGAKNASYKLMISSIMASSESRILNLPKIADVERVATIIEELGGSIKDSGTKTLLVDPRDISKFEIDLRHGKASRASTLFLGPLLAKFKQAKVPLPGGDKIGKRPLGRHLIGLEKLGVKWKHQDDFLELKTNGLKGTNYTFKKNTHTGTETLVMAAVMADGKTVLENAAEEPEIDDLINYLNQMGARIRRRAFRTIEIEGVNELHGAIHKVTPDRNEAVSYACGALATKGDIVIENARREDLSAFIDKVREAGGGVEEGQYGVRFYYKEPLRATDVVTEIHPGFMTDWQPLWATLMCHAQGESIIHEIIMQNRFQYVSHLKQMGAKIEEIKPNVTHPEKLYNFNWEDCKESDIHAIKITGPTSFVGGEFEVHDLRAGATILLAAISAKGQTVLSNVDQIDRGYENIDQKLRSLGANIKRE